MLRQPKLGPLERCTTSWAEGLKGRRYSGTGWTVTTSAVVRAANSEDLLEVDDVPFNFTKLTISVS